jgi:hypothetical protein
MRIAALRFGHVPVIAAWLRSTPLRSAPLKFDPLRSIVVRQTVKSSMTLGS